MWVTNHSKILSNYRYVLNHRKYQEIWATHWQIKTNPNFFLIFDKTAILWVQTDIIRQCTIWASVKRQLFKVHMRAVQQNVKLLSTSQEQTINYPTASNHPEIGLLSVLPSKHHSDDRVLDWPEMMSQLCRGCRGHPRGAKGCTMDRVSWEHSLLRSCSTFITCVYCFRPKPIVQANPCLLESVSHKRKSNHQSYAAHTPDKHS